MFYLTNYASTIKLTGKLAIKLSLTTTIGMFATLSITNMLAKQPKMAPLKWHPKH